MVVWAKDNPSITACAIRDSSPGGFSRDDRKWVCLEILHVRAMPSRTTWCEFGRDSAVSRSKRAFWFGVACAIIINRARVDRCMPDPQGFDNKLKRFPEGRNWSGVVAGISSAHSATRAIISLIISVLALA